MGAPGLTYLHLPRRRCFCLWSYPGGALEIWRPRCAITRHQETLPLSSFCPVKPSPGATFCSPTKLRLPDLTCVCWAASSLVIVHRFRNQSHVPGGEAMVTSAKSELIREVPSVLLLISPRAVTRGCMEHR